jgi:hypothetical protein
MVSGCWPEYTRLDDPVRGWLYDRGASGDWTTCLPIASVLRAACEGDQRCERVVSEEMSFHCYAGSYRGARTTTSPCINAHDEAQAVVACDRLEAALRPHCLAELALYRNDICRRGSPTLTGAGP